MPTPEWARCHIEVYECPGWLDDCFRTGWTKFQSTASESFQNTGDVSGDYAVMAVTEGATPSGCGYRKDLSTENLGTDDYPLLRTRLRGRGTTPQYRIEVEYIDSTVTNSGWIDAPAGFEVKTLVLSAGKTVKYVKLYAKSNTGSGIAYIDYDYTGIIRNPPLIPVEVLELDADLRVNNAVSGLRLKLLNDPLLGVTDRRYRFELGQGSVAYDLSSNKEHGDIVNATWNTSGRYGGCLYFLASGSCRLETGYKPTIAGDDALSIVFWVKAASGASGVVCGSGKTIGADWNRLQFNWSSDKLRLYVKDDSGHVLQVTSVKTVADNQWHQVAGIFSPSGDCIKLFIDGDFDVEALGTLDGITLDTNDLTFGCLHTDAGYTDYTTCYLDEAIVTSRALEDEEVYQLYVREPLSGVARAGAGNIVMLYLAAPDESLVHKLVSARVIDRTASGEPDEPVVELVCEDLGEILHERSFTREYAMARWISGVAEDIVADVVPELDVDADQTDRTIQNTFKDEGVWGLLGRLADAAHYSTGESGANIYVDPGCCLRFKKYGAFSCGYRVTDGSDGYPANILDMDVRETLKGDPKLANDVKVIIFEEEALPRDEDSYTESADSWSSPDPTDTGYPQSDTGDFQSGTASIHFNTTNPGSQYRMRHVFSEVDLTGLDELRFWFKYGSGLSPEALEIRLQKGAWLWTWDYYVKNGISIPATDTWGEISVDLSSMAKGGHPGKIVDHLHIRPYRASGDLGVGGFLIDKLRFIRAEKAGTAEDASSQQSYGKRTYREVDKTITDLDYAGFLAGNILEHRKNPLVLVSARVPAKGQTGYRPPMLCTVTSLKDGIDEEVFQIQRARHRYTSGEGYFCDLELVAARTPGGVYEAKVAPASSDLASSLALLRRRQEVAEFSSLRDVWE